MSLNNHLLRILNTLTKPADKLASHATSPIVVNSRQLESCKNDEDAENVRCENKMFNDRYSHDTAQTETSDNLMRNWGNIS
jgi:hypothetical protein